MKLTKILMSGAAILTPAVVLPLVNAAKVEKTTNATKNTNEKVVSNEIITVGTDGWVNVDEKGLVKYHLTFKEAQKTCTLDRMTVNCSASDKITLKPQAEYKSEKYPQVDKFELTLLDVHGGCSGSGELEWLDFADAKNIQEIGAQSFDTGNDGGCGFRIRHVSFTGATSLRKIGKLAFWNQYLERDSEDLDLDFSSTQLEEVGEDAFRACCRSGAKYSFTRSIIFPATLKKIDKCAFETYKGQNNFCPRKVIFLGETPPELGDGGSLPSVADSVSGQTCVAVPTGKKSAYWDAWTPAHSPRNYELGKPIKESNLVESNIHFADFGVEGAGPEKLCSQYGHSGKDETHKWCPLSLSGVKTLDCKVWLTNDIDGKLHITNTGGEYWISWDSDIPVGKYTYKVMASHASDQYMTFACSKDCTITISDATVSGGSSVVRASYYEGKDEKSWTAALSDNTIQSVAWTITADDDVKEVVSLETSGTASETATLKWITNGLPVGSYDIKINAEITDTDGFTYNVSTPVTFIVQSTYYKINASQTTLDLELDGTKTGSITITTEEGGVAKFDGDLSVPQLSIASRKGIAFTKTETAGTYKLDLTADTESTKGLTAGSYSFYVYSTAKIKVAGQVIDYPVYSQDITVNVKATSGTAKTCTGGSGDLTSYNGTAGSDTKQWSIQSGGTIKGLTITPASWTTFDPQRMSHIKGTLDSEDKSKFTISWDEKFTAMETWWEIVDFNVEFNGEFTSANGNSTSEHYVVPITMSIRNAGETKSAAGSNIYGYPNTAVELSTEPWQMYSNGSDLPVSTDVDFWIEDDELPLEAQGRIWMKADTSDPSIAYLNYANLPKGTYTFNIYAYDYENVVYTQQTITLRIANIATIYGAPSSLSINRGNGRLSQPLSIKVNGDDWTGDVTYKVYNIDEEAFNVDENGCIYWTDKLVEGVYDPMIYAIVTLQDDTVTSVPIQIKLTVNSAAGPNVGAIVGGTVGGTVGAGGAATGGYFGIKKYKSVKGKKK